jgi:hypothetical protein
MIHDGFYKLRYVVKCTITKKYSLDRLYIYTLIHLFGFATRHRSVCSNTDISVRSCHLQMERAILYHSNAEDKKLLGQTNHLSF